MRQRAFKTVPLHILLVLSCIVMSYPFIIIIITAFKSNAEVFQNPIGLPRHLTFENFITSWRQAGFTGLFRNSIFLTGASMSVASIVASLAAFAIVRRLTRVSSVVYLLLAAGIFLPLQLAIIPQFRVLKELGLIDTYVGVILVYVTTGIPFGVFLIAAFMKNIPTEIPEAATIDGASYFRLYWSVYLPLARPAIGTFLLLQGVQVWNDYLVPLLLLTDPSKRTLTTGILVFKQQYLAQWGNIMAGVLIMSVPVIVLFIFAQRYFIQGLYSGSAK